MKKIVLLILFLFLVQIPSHAIFIGSYKTETEYGLIDGFKFNFFKKNKDKKLIELKSETKEEQARLEREKNKPKEEQNEYELFRYMQQNTVPF